MRKNKFILIASLFLAFTSKALSQETSLNDSTRSKSNNYSVEKAIPDLYLVISWQQWINMPSNIGLKNGSTREFSMYAVKNILKNDRHFNVATGISASFYNFKDKVQDWVFTAGGKIDPKHLDTAIYNKNKTLLVYLDIPVELKYRFGLHPQKSTCIGIGVKGGVLVDADNKNKSGKITTKTNIFSGFNNIDYSLYGYIKYRSLCFFGQYGLSPLFDSENAPVTNFWSVGIGLIL